MELFVCSDLLYIAKSSKVGDEVRLSRKINHFDRMIILLPMLFSFSGLTPESTKINLKELEKLALADP